MAKKLAKKKVKQKQKPKQKQKQAQKQSQRTSVTINLNTKSKTKRKLPRATNGNTNRVLQQFAQPLITLPSNLINPPTIPQSGLIPSPLQTRRNDGEAVSMGQRLGSDSAMREQMRTGVGPNDEQSLSGFSFDSRPDTLRNYQEPSVASGITPSLDSLFSNFTVDTSDKSSSVTPPQPIKDTSSSMPRQIRSGNRRRTPQIAEGRENIEYYFQNNEPFRESVGELAAELPQPVGVPMPGNPTLRPPDDRYTDRLITDYTTSTRFYS